MYDIENLEVTPPVFAKLVGVSTSKLLRGDADEDRVRKAQFDLQQIRALTSEDPQEWLTRPLSVDHAVVTPLDIWRYSPDISTLLDDPVSELDRTCPQWRLLYHKKGAPLP